MTYCLISGTLCWLKRAAVMSADGLTVLWLGQLLDGQRIAAERWLQLIIWLSNHCVVSGSRHHPRVSVWRLFCWLYNIPYYTFIGWTNQKMFLICSPPPPSCLLFPPIPLCFHFSSQEVIYCQTHSNSQPQLHTLIYPNRPMTSFIFPIFSPAFFFCHDWTVWL